MTDAWHYTPSGRPRARALTIPFPGQPAALNSITDVPGVEVGYETLIEGDDVRTGVTAILPRGKRGVGVSCASGFHSFNGNGELTGSHWLAETGLLGWPVMITNTYAVGPVHRGVIDWVVREQPNQTPWDFPVVGETYDGYLNDINRSTVTAQHAVNAIDNAKTGPIEEGPVGGGTGMNSYGFKAGSGTASRKVPYAGTDYTVGVFIQANFGARRQLTIAGRSLGKVFADDNPMAETNWFVPPGAGSAIVVVATDAPLLPQQCAALARRATIGLGRTGTTGNHSSGDIFLAFSTGNPGALSSPPAAQREALSRLEFVPWHGIDPFLEATAYAVEEAAVNALVVNETMIGRDGHRSPAIPRERLVGLFSE
ncbi:S58 family peptidase [Kibdelosporangium aridum]|uniref:S58 family peptidase n=1 Tax=Kibdelosporangium aridum TaxID=2030 RepID=A0A428YX57_KIBAR|nr:P1 family peptidase [Kibdelosporangium aridum]RSM74748.1 S58 family peptidase [Kibdelosporangium aridum]